MTIGNLDYAPILEPPAHWMEQAACTGFDPELWFPTTKDEEGHEAALAVCNACPVRDECLQMALDLRDMHGIWGGLTRDERLTLLTPGRTCLHCHHPLPEDAHHTRRVHEECATPWKTANAKARRHNQPRTCHDCGNPREPRKRYCTTCRRRRKRASSRAHHARLKNKETT